MTRQERIFQYITSHLVKGTAAAGLTFDPGRDLMETDVLDSVAMMELIVWLEDEFGIAIGTDDLTPDNFATLDAMDRYIEKALAAARP